jgi:dihydroorotate dehydrogenase electron transfer subunit
MAMTMQTENAPIVRHDAFAGDYRLIVLCAPAIAASCRPGQFLHLRVPGLGQTALRRPFSIYRAEGDEVSVLYKPVGRGTRVMVESQPGETISVIGPLGNGFPLEDDGTDPLLVAGGYGVAPLSFLAHRLGRGGTVFIGGRTASDILCTEDFTAWGWEVIITTENGSRGSPGKVTGALDAWLARRDAAAQAANNITCYACGPEGLMHELALRGVARGWHTWLSLDRPMGCGIGACLACVQRVRLPDGATGWARCCREGPVFEARELVWNDDAAEDAAPESATALKGGAS